MSVKEFVDNLKNLVPSGAYYNSNFSKEFIETVNKKYCLVSKDNLPSTGNVILDLINNYNSSYVRFGDYSFLSEIVDMHEVQAFCQSSGTYLGFKEIDGKILEFDRDEDSLIGYCADNAENFLKAVLVLYEYHTERVMGLIDRNDVEKKEEFIKRCAETAGSVKYDDLYRAVIQ